MSSPLPPAATGLARIPGVDLACASLATQGLAITATPEGRCTLVAERVVAQGVRGVIAHATVEIAEMTLADVRSEIVPVAGAPALASFNARTLTLEGLQAALAREAFAATGPVAEVRLDALAALEGLVHAFVTNALWFVDADISVPVRQGAIDFNDVEIEHVGPNSTLGVSPAGIHVEGPAKQRRMPVVTFGAPPPPGVSFATDSRLPFVRSDRGRLDLLPFLQALLEAPRDAPVARPADASVAGALLRTRLRGELQLGDGVLARGDQRVELAGRAAGKNRCTLDSPSLAQRLVIRVPEFAAGATAFVLPGREVRTAALTAAVEVHVLGAEAPANSAGMVLSIAQATLHDVTLAAPAAT